MVDNLYCAMLEKSFGMGAARIKPH